MTHEQIEAMLLGKGYTPEQIAEAKREAEEIKARIAAPLATDLPPVTAETLRVIAEAMAAADAKFDTVTVGRVGGADPTVLGNVTVRRGEITTRFMVRTAEKLAAGFRQTVNGI